MPSEEKRNQEIRPFTKIDDSFKKIVITGDMSPTYYNDDGVLFMNIFDFLLKPESCCSSNLNFFDSYDSTSFSQMISTAIARAYELTILGQTPF